jgi:hypothetical protein
MHSAQSPCIDLDHIQTISLVRLNPPVPNQSEALYTRYTKTHKQLQAFHACISESLEHRTSENNADQIYPDGKLHLPSNSSITPDSITPPLNQPYPIYIPLPQHQSALPTTPQGLNGLPSSNSTKNHKASLALSNCPLLSCALASKLQASLSSHPSPLFVKLCSRK